MTMKRSMRKLARVGIAVSLVAATAACGGGAANVKVESPASANGSVSVQAQLNLPKVGDPKYDKFFSDVVDLAQLVADARASLDNASVTLNQAMGVTEATNFETAVKNMSGKLNGKVTVTFGVGPTGANVNVVAAPGMTLSAEDQAMVNAYKKVLTDVAVIPAKLAPVVPKSIDLVKQAVVLALNAKSDFTGIKVVTTLPGVIAGIEKVKVAMDQIKTDVPVIIDKGQTMTVAIRGAVAAPGEPAPAVAAPASVVLAPAPVVVAPAPVVVASPQAPKLAAVCDARINANGHLHFPHEVEFDEGKATIKSTPTTNAILQCLVDFFANNPMVTKFRLEGYTDNKGDAALNKALSEQRAQAVVAWLTNHNVPAGKLWAKGYGPAKPVAPNDTPENMAKNRRVEFHID
jgi:outer membrane protein OmpA-like peptidoglycan-associated protein